MEPNSTQIMTLIIALSLFSSFISCTNSNTQSTSDEFVEIDILTGESVQLNLSEIIKKTTYIQLETNEECLIGSSYNFSFYNDQIYVFDAMNARILCFDTNGDYLFKIDRKGNGPGEYNHLSDFVVDKANDLLLIYDRMQTEVLEFSLSGEYIKSIKVNVQLAELGVIDSDSYYFYNYDGPDPSFVLQRVNKKDGALMSENIVQNKSTDFLRHASFNQDNDDLTFCYAFNDTIYKICDEGTIQRLLVINFPKKAKLLEDLSAVPYHDREGQRSIMYKSDWASIGYHRKSSHQLYFYYFNGQDTHQVLLSLETGKYHHFDKINNDVDGIPLSSRPIHLSDKTIMFKVDPLQIIEEMEKNDERISKVLDKMKPIKEDSNPIIAVSTIRRF